MNPLLPIRQECFAKQYRTLGAIRILSRGERYREDAALLTGIPGIGLVTTMALLTEIGDVSRFGGLDALCSSVGQVPMTGSSGGEGIDGADHDQAKRRAESHDSGELMGRH